MDVIDAEIMARLFPYLKDPDLIRQTLSSTLIEQQQERNKVEAQRVSIERRISDLHLELKRLRDGFAAGVLTGDELKMERQTRDDAIAALKVELADAEQRIEQIGIDDLEEKVELVVSCLSQPGFHTGDPAISLTALFPNRLAQACNHYKTKGLTVKEYQRIAVGWPATDDMDAGVKFLKVVQTLGKRVTIDTESRIVDYDLWIEPTPPEGPDGEEPENHRANLNSMTMDFHSVYEFDWFLPPAPGVDPTPGRRVRRKGSRQGA